MKKLFLLAAVMLTSSFAQAQDLISIRQEPQLFCLAQNIYYEARGSSRADQMAVSDVVLNRVKDARYPNTICEVVYQGKQKPSWKDPTKMVMVRNMCQFSWYCDGKSDTPHDPEAWAWAVLVAYDVLQSRVPDPTYGATHYHATYVKPYWADHYKQTVTLGSHIFYK